MKINGLNSVSYQYQANNNKRVNNENKFNEYLKTNFEKKVNLDLNNEEIQYFKKTYPVNAYEVANYKSPFAEIKLGQIIDRKV